MSPKGESGTNPEMLTRWLQYGVFTPIFKTHSTKNSSLERRIWAFPDYYEAMKDAIRLRYTLSPYIYTAARAAYDTGVSMCRPMYYDYPEADEAYTWNKQFMFGDDILACTIDQPADQVTALAERTWWLPEGNDWYDVVTGAILKGGQKVAGHYTIDENPYFIKAGAIIPMASKEIQTLQEENDQLYLYIAPGMCDSQTSVYEDDGNSQAYETDYATTLVTKTIADGKAIVKIDARKGEYAGMKPERRLRVIFDNILPPTCVKVNGVEVPYSRFEGTGCWMYDGRELAATVVLDATSCNEDVTVEITYNPQDSRELLDGKKALMNRMYKLTPEAKLLFCSLEDAFMMLPIDYLKASQCASLVNEDPENAAQYLSDIDLEAVYKAVEVYEHIPADFKAKVRAQAQVGFVPAE